MHRSRSLTYLIGALLAIFTLYTLFSVSQPPDLRIIKTQTPPQSPNIDRPSSATPPGEKERPQHPFDNDKWHPPLYEDAAGVDDPEEQLSTEYPAGSSSQSFQASPSTLSIENLIKRAEKQFEETLAQRTNTLEEAAAAYRKRRGRHPPPGFDRWYKYAIDNDAIMVEDYFDQIYHDLNPFWAISPKMLRAQARAEEMAVEVKDGKAKANTDWFWHEIWGRMIDQVADYLPDMYIAINSMDESRLLVNWEKINEYMEVVEREKKLTPPDQVQTKVQGWNAEKEQDAPNTPDPQWNGYGVYKYARTACSPDSPARQVGGILYPERILGEYLKNTSDPERLRYFDGRFVSNYTEASDYCSDASIGGLHGALIHPLSCKVTNVLIPMFGGSKFHTNNEILLPAPMYWNEDTKFGGGAGDQVAWNIKTPTAIWRGTATGGRTKPYTWNLFHRHRFVAITNGTKYDLASPTSDPVFSPFFRESAVKHLHSATQAHLSAWLDATHDTSFTDLVCDEVEDGGTCWYTDDEYVRKPGIKFSEQFAHKYVPDVDGNSFSGRYRAFLMSNSLPIKATIYREWHDSRLTPWKHFVPMNNRFSDYYSIMEYFVGSEPAGLVGHDDEAKKIATEGRAWAEKVLRKVDMQIYVGRLLLEYGRLTDDNRAVLGWVEDLLHT